MMTTKEQTANLPAPVSLEQYESIVEELSRQRQRNRELQAELNLRRSQEKGEVWFWQAEGGNYINSLSCPVVIAARDLRELLDARPIKPTNDHIKHDVLDRAYDFTIDWDGNVLGLTAGDMSYDYTGIKLSAETMKDFLARKESDEDLAVQARFYQRGAEKRIDDVLDQLGFQAPESTTWWHIVEFLHERGHHLNAGLAQRHAVPLLPRSDQPTKPE
jgi:hypothetical protein